MEKAKISLRQLFVLMMLFELGGAVAIGTGGGAKKDAWLAILLGTVGGLLILLVYQALYKLYPRLLLTGYVQQIVGKYIGWPIAFLYTVHFMYQAARNLRGCGNLLVIAVYDRTPLFAINSLMMIAIVYMLYKGVEVLSRTGEFYILLLVFLGVLGSILLFASGVVELKNLQPILEKGWKPVIQTVPNTYFFPFAELLAFTMLMPYLNDTKGTVRTGCFAVAASGLILSYTMALNIAVLGANITGRAIFPLFTTISKINIADFLQRLDAIAISTLIISYYFKTTIYSYIAVIGAVDLFNLQNHKKLVIPFGFLILLSSLMISSNYSENYVEGLKINPYVAFPFQTAFPVLLLVIALIRRRWGKRPKGSVSQS